MTVQIELELPAAASACFPQVKLVQARADGPAPHVSRKGARRFLVQLAEIPYSAEVGDIPVDVLCPNFKAHRVNLGPITRGSGSLTLAARKLELTPTTNMLKLELLEQPMRDQDDIVLDILVQSTGGRTQLDVIKLRFEHDPTPEGCLQSSSSVAATYVLTVAAGKVDAAIAGEQIAVEASNSFPCGGDRSVWLVNFRFPQYLESQTPMRYRIRVQADSLQPHWFDRVRASLRGTVDSDGSILEARHTLSLRKVP